MSLEFGFVWFNSSMLLNLCNPSLLFAEKIYTKALIFFLFGEEKQDDLVFPCNKFSTTQLKRSSKIVDGVYSYFDIRKLHAVLH